MFSLKFCKTRGFVPNTLFLKGFDYLGIYIYIYVCVYFFLIARKLAGEHEYVCNVHLSKMSPFWLK